MARTGTGLGRAARLTSGSAKAESSTARPESSRRAVLSASRSAPDELCGGTGREQYDACVIDLHAHVLPGIDDGPSSLEESVALAEAACQDGVRTLALTPHLRDDHPRVVPHELKAHREALAERLAAESYDLELVTGGELDLVWAQRASAEELVLVSYNQAGSDLLIETPYGELPYHFEQMLDALQERGFRLLLAHPERNPTLRADPARLRRLVQRGILVQVTAASLSGPRRSRSRQLALAAIKEGVAHVIASDAHGEATVARAGLSDGVAAALNADPSRPEWMVTEAPAAILAGSPLPPAPAPASIGPVGQRLRSILSGGSVPASSRVRRRR
jgi:protein-tyrosine phosphatase